MNRTCVALCALVMVGACGKAKALKPDEYGMTGNELLGFCRNESNGPASPKNPAIAYCGGYILGVHDALLFAGTPGWLCQPATNVTNRQVIDIVVRYLIENPATRNKDAAILTSMALSKAYPCP